MSVLVIAEHHQGRIADNLAQLVAAAGLLGGEVHVLLLGQGLTACQWTADGVAEAIVHETLPVLGVQYHPERQSFRRRRDDAADAAALFRWWAAQVKS